MDTSPTGFDHECLLLALATSLLHAYETSPALTSSINVYKYNTYTVYYVLVCTACPQTRQLEKPPRRNANATGIVVCVYNIIMICFFHSTTTTAGRHTKLYFIFTRVAVFVYIIQVNLILAFIENNYGLLQNTTIIS